MNDDSPSQVAARAWLHEYGVSTSEYMAGGGDHPAMRTLPAAFEAFSKSQHAERWNRRAPLLADDATVERIARLAFPAAFWNLPAATPDQAADAIADVRAILTALAALGKEPETVKDDIA